MKVLKRYRYHILAVTLLLTLLLVGTKTKVHAKTEAVLDLPTVQTTTQHQHAAEIFSIGRTPAMVSLDPNIDYRPVILEFVKKSLPEESQSKAFEIAYSVIREANHHQMDPFFLLAVIATESKFHVKARGHHGEIGLMQILPKTAQWLAQQAGLKRSQINLEDPSINIRIGATYLAHLRLKFKKVSGRYVAAYNMGSTNVRRLLSTRVEPKVYASKVFENYLRIYSEIEPSVESAHISRGRTIAAR